MYYFIFPVPRNKEKNSLKRSEIEVNIILKRKKQFMLRLANSFHQVPNDADKQIRF